MSIKEAICPGLTVDHNGRMFSIDKTGRLNRRSGEPLLPQKKQIVIFVNGFNFDPTEIGDDNPHQTLFPNWRARLLGTRNSTDLECFGFGWYSAELEPSSAFGGFIRGHWNPYRWSWELAGKAGGILAKMVDRHVNGSEGREVYFVAHSIGVRVALSALHQLCESSVKRSLFLNGSEYSQTAKVIACHTRSKVLNVIVEEDDILDKLGSVFAPEAFIKDVVGQSGLIEPPNNWLDFRLDDRRVQEKAQACGYGCLRGDNPDSWADHWYSYEHEPNWKFFRHFLLGKKKLSKLRCIANPPRESVE